MTSRAAIPVAFGLCFTFAAGCTGRDGERDRQYLIYVTAKAWRIDLEVNGQPAGRHENTDTTITTDITHLVVNGENALRIVGERLPKGDPEAQQYCDIRLCSRPGDDPSGRLKTITAVFGPAPGGEDRFEKIVPFTAAMTASAARPQVTTTTRGAP